MWWEYVVTLLLLISALVMVGVVTGLANLQQTYTNLLIASCVIISVLILTILYFAFAYGSGGTVEIEGNTFKGFIKKRGVSKPKARRPAFGSRPRSVELQQR